MALEKGEYMDKMRRFFKDWRKQSHYFNWLMQYAKPYLPRIIFMMFMQMTGTILTVGLAVVSKNIIDAATSGGIVVWTFALYIGIVLVSQLITVISGLISIMLNERFSFGIRKQLYEKIIESSWMDVKKYHTGDLLTRLTSDAGVISDGIVIIIPTIIQLLVELLVTFFTLFYYEPRLAFFALIMAPVAGITGVLIGKKLKDLQIKVQESEANYRSYIQESLSNLLVIKAFTNEKHSVDRLVELREERFYWVYKKSKLGILSSMSLALTFQFGYIGAFTVGAFELARKTITFGTMSVFLTLVNRIQSPIVNLAQMIPKVVSVLASAGRVIEIQDLPVEERLESNISMEQVGVQAQNLNFGYSDDTVLENVNFKINPGEFIAIVGASGIGKTTLVRLIMSFMKSAEGSIEFWNEAGDKENANAAVREYISYVPQGNTLFSGTIRENICMGKLDATEEEIKQALELSAAAAFIKELPNGLDTIVGEQGHGVSEGQAQRIAIARALIRKSPFLILDEATSALDETTELYVLEGIQKLSPRPTCLLITHRRSVLKYCDRELQIENKKVQEFEIDNSL